MKCDNYGSTDEERRNQSQSEMGMDNVISAFLHDGRQEQHLSQVRPSWPVPLNYANVYGQIRVAFSHRLNLFLHKGAYERPLRQLDKGWSLPVFSLPSFHPIAVELILIFTLKNLLIDCRNLFVSCILVIAYL